jgi:hypothetical protein
LSNADRVCHAAVTKGKTLIVIGGTRKDAEGKYQYLDSWTAEVRSTAKRGVASPVKGPKSAPQPRKGAAAALGRSRLEGKARPKAAVTMDVPVEDDDESEATKPCAPPPLPTPPHQAPAAGFEKIGRDPRPLNPRL